MHSIPILFTLWPGLPQLWLQGRWSGLIKAIAFAGFLNFVLFATYQHKDLLPKSGLIGCWILLGVFWTIAIFQNDRMVKNHQSSMRDDSRELDELFRLAQLEYLRGRLKEAEILLERLLGLNPRDVDARLYLATIHRHQGRLHQAARQLDCLEQDPESDRWLFQIQEEREKLSELETELAGASEEDERLSGMEMDLNFDDQPGEEPVSGSADDAASSDANRRFAA